MRRLKKLLSLTLVGSLFWITSLWGAPHALAQQFESGETYNVYIPGSGGGKEMSGEEINTYNEQVNPTSSTQNESSSSSLSTTNGAKNPFKIDDFIKVSNAQNKDELTKDKARYEKELEDIKAQYYDIKNKLFARLVAYDTVNSEGMGNRFTQGTIDTIVGALTGDSISQGLKNLGKVGGAIGDLFLNTWELNVVTNNEDLDEIYEMVKKKYANDPQSLELANNLRDVGRQFHALERKIDALNNIDETDGETTIHYSAKGKYSTLFAN